MARSLTYDDIEYISSQIKDDSLWRSIFSYYFSYNLSAFRIPLVKNMCSQLSIDSISINSENYHLLKERITPILFSDPKFNQKLRNNLIAPYDKKHKTHFATFMLVGAVDKKFDFPQKLLDKFIIDYCTLRKLHLITYNGKDFLSDMDEDISESVSYYQFYNSKMLSENTRVKLVENLMRFYRQLFIDNMAKILEITLYKYEQNIATRYDYDVDKIIKSLLSIKTSWGTPQLSALSDVTKELFNAMNIVFSQSITEAIDII